MKGWDKGLLRRLHAASPASGPYTSTPPCDLPAGWDRVEVREACEASWRDAAAKLAAGVYTVPRWTAAAYVRANEDRRDNATSAQEK
jgi:hypothetical protein